MQNTKRVEQFKVCVLSNLERIKGLGVVSMIVIGSYARGEQKENSDLDVLIEWEKREYRVKNIEELYKWLEKDLGFRIDFVHETNLTAAGYIKPFTFPQIKIFPL